MKYYKNIIALCLLFQGVVVMAQFNTLTYIPKNKEIKDEVKETIAENKENQSTPKPKKSKRNSKAELKKEIDSLKFQLLKENFRNQQEQKINVQKIEDSIIQSVKKKMNDFQFSTVKIRKFDFINDENTIAKIAMPLRGKLTITSPFGVRTHPIFGGKKAHNGVDFSANYDSVYSVLDGVVSEAGWDSKGGGNYIKIRHSERFETAYLHLSQIYYKVGERVNAGFVIGRSGNTGNSTGPHLHFAVKEYGNFINPIHFLNNIISINNLIALNNEK